MYHIQLLNDLHNWFPELLYNSPRFQSVQDVLGYIIQVANDNSYQVAHQRYNSYRYHMENNQSYLNTPINSSPSIYAPPNLNVSTRQNVASASSNGSSNASNASNSSSNASNASNSSNASSGSLFSAGPLSNIFDLLYGDHQMDSDEPNTHVHITHTTLPAVSLNMNQDNIITSILGQVLYGRRDASAMQNFLNQTVVIHPSDDQIDNNTSVNTATRTQDDNCAICQDEIEEGQEMRSINHCRHLFHKHCIDTWFQTNVRCPSCRHDIRE